MPRIASYNCQQSHDRAVRFLGARIAEEVDASCTQESGTRMALQESLAVVPNMMSADAYLNDPCALVTHTLTRASADATIPIGAGLNGNRSALLTRLRCGLVVVNVHLTSGNERRAREELVAVRQYLQDHHRGEPWLIIGDFNHDPQRDHAGVHFARGPQHQSGSYLDWAMAGGVAGIAAGEYPRYHGSDHGPWYVDVDL